jgi:biotin carboxyl carrier protein
MQYIVMVGERRFAIDIERDEQRRWQIQVNGTPIAVDSAMVSAGHLSLLAGMRVFETFVETLPLGEPGTGERGYRVLLGGMPYAATVADARRQALAGLARGGREHGEIAVKAPMPGLVANVLVTAGDTVERGQRIVVLEAMKMQNDLLAPRGGVIHAVQVAAGQAVTQGQPLLTIGDPAGAAPPAPEDDDI